MTARDHHGSWMLAVEGLLCRRSSTNQGCSGAGSGGGRSPLPVVRECVIDGPYILEQFSCKASPTLLLVGPPSILGLHPWY